MKLKAVVTFSILLTLSFSGRDLSAGVTEYRGGSNYVSYQMDGCEREKYGVVSEYDVGHEAIDSQLAKMYANGQRRLRIPISFGHGLKGGTNMDSTGGNLAPRYRANLAALLAAVKKAGFEEVEIGFFAQGINFPWKWTEWNEEIYQENWNLIVNLRPIIVASGLPYRIDLMNEAIPAANQAIFVHYDQRLWADYTRNYGKDDTVGFSIIPNADHAKEIQTIYGNNLPAAFDFHFYKNPAQGLIEANTILKSTSAANIPWIIGETYYNDDGEAAFIEGAIKQTGQKILYLLQWPLSPAQKCPAVDHMPFDFDKYAAHGF